MTTEDKSGQTKEEHDKRFKELASQLREKLLKKSDMTTEDKSEHDTKKTKNKVKNDDNNLKAMTKEEHDKRFKELASQLREKLLKKVGGTSL